MSTGGLLASASDDGRPTMVVTATDGAEGEIHNYDDPDSIKPRLAEVRAEEMAASMSILGVGEQHFLGYRDSGMMGESSNLHPNAFWQADFDDAVGRLIRHIRMFRPDVMTIYDPYGGYGHPDHINVHRVGLAAFWASLDQDRYPLGEGEEPWSVPKLYWSAWPRSRRQGSAQMRLEAGEMTQEEFDRAMVSGAPDDMLTFLSVPEYVDVKLKALRAHRTQIPDDWLFFQIPDDLRDHRFSVETFYMVHSGVPDDGTIWSGIG